MSVLHRTAKVAMGESHIEQGAGSASLSRVKGAIWVYLQAPGTAQGERLWPGTDLPTAEEARQQWEARIAHSPTIPQESPPAVSTPM